MKFKMILILVAVALVSFGLYGTGYAFHEGGVGRCEGCHTMHNSVNGGAMRTAGGMVQYQAGPWLLQGADASSACLNCHQGTGGSYQVSTAGVDSTLAVLPNSYDKAGGDFSWIKTTTGNNSLNRGHSIVSASYAYTADTVRTTAPGGTYKAADLGCTGCHDPHGKTRRLEDGTYTQGGAPIVSSGSHGEVPEIGSAVGAYRFLGGAGYTPKASTVAISFANNPPYAAAVSYGNGDKVAYGQGMSEWCANCHSGIYEAGFVSGVGGHRHPAANTQKLGTAIADNYNAYMGSGVTGGTPSTAKYNRLVPSEEGSTDVATLYTHASSTDNTAPSATSNVMCVSCHRAHASGFSSMGRFTFGSELVTDETGGWEAIDGQPSTAYAQRAYNNNTFGNAQRALCNKCHAKD